ncbi:DUF4386 family protein [uncultured Muriicola sp.]|uniref:DUF4386 family protein n=1 Tax=uncultured Muriicola sp. TaxID=1583102 RepID=UPI0026312410|nr:DUF4386 family protein [uncultured Muriicola sp.]
MMNDLQKMGGVAALIEAATFVVGFGLVLAIVIPAGFFTGDIGPGQIVALLADNQAITYIVYLLIYVIHGVFLVVLALALYERLKAGSPAMVQTATAFGLIWAGLEIATGMVSNFGLDTIVDLYGKDPAQAESVWLVFDFVQNGLGPKNLIPGSLWILLVSWAALRAGELPSALNYLGLVIGVVGILAAVPPLVMLGAFVWLGLIVWWVWVGIVILRSSLK